MTSANELAALAERIKDAGLNFGDQSDPLTIKVNVAERDLIVSALRATSTAGVREASNRYSRAVYWLKRYQRDEHLTDADCEELDALINVLGREKSPTNSEWNAADETAEQRVARYLREGIPAFAHAGWDESGRRKYKPPYDRDADAINASLHRGEAQRTDGGREPGFIKPDNDRQVFFYEQDFYVLSNFSAFNLKWANLTFPTSEHAYHYEKFLFSGEMRRLRPIREAIRGAPSAHEAFKIAENEKANRRPDWDYVKVPIMKRILGAKAEQHEYVRRKLLATGDRELIEDSWRDDFWGWGPNRDGQNILGKLWMQVRDELRTAPQTDGGEER